MNYLKFEECLNFINKKKKEKSYLKKPKKYKKQKTIYFRVSS